MFSRRRNVDRDSGRAIALFQSPLYCSMFGPEDAVVPVVSLLASSLTTWDLGDYVLGSQASIVAGDGVRRVLASYVSLIVYSSWPKQSKYLRSTLFGMRSRAAMNLCIQQNPLHSWINEQTAMLRPCTYPPLSCRGVVWLPCN